MPRTTARRPRSSHRPDVPPPRRRRRTPVVLGAVVVVVLALVAIDVSIPASDAPLDQSSGTARAGSLVVEGAEVELGSVPLDVTVNPTWTLTNTGGQSVRLGEPHATVVEGCCPGPLLLDRRELAPGESTELTFPLQMHAGMDGPHDFDVHVPILDGDDEYLTLGVTGDFGA